MLAEERHRRILDMIQQQGIVTISDIARECQISDITVRRDLDYLAQLSKIDRIRGGAKPVAEIKEDLNQRFQRHAEENKEEKKDIGRFAASLVQDGDIIILDAGSTTLQIAKHLVGKRDITAVVTSIHIAQELEGKDGITTILTGGTLRSSSTSLLNPLLKQSLSQIYADKVFIGIQGISASHGFTTNDFADAEVKKMLFKSAQCVYVVADTSKFNRITAAHIGHLDEAHYIITNYLPDTEFLQGLKDFKCQALLAERREI
jgi:DeoR/GlpR family transcriptional regulator of sugar metabolism